MSEFLTKTSTGIYIGFNKIAVSQISCFMGRLKLIKEADVDLSALRSSEDANAGFPLDIEHGEKGIKIKALKNLLEENNFDTKNISLVLPNKDLMIRYFTLPKITRREIPSTVKFEAKNYIPFNLEEVHSDYHILSYGGRKKEMEILFTAAKKNLIDENLEILNKCGLNVKKIRIPAISLLNVLLKYKDRFNIDKSSYMLVDIIEGVVTITIFRDNKPYLVRDFSLNEFSSEDKLTDEDFENFIHELHLSLEYYYGQFPSKEVKKIFIFDDGTLEHRIEDLKSEFNISIVKPDLNQILKNTDKKEFSSQIILSTVSTMMSCLKKTIDINLIPEGEIVQEEPVVEKPLSVPRFLIVEMVALLVGLSILYFVLGKNMMASIQEQIHNVRMSRKKVDASFVDMSELKLQEVLKKFEQKKDLVTSVIENRVYFTEKMNRLVIALPSGVWLESISYKNDSEQIKNKNPLINIQGMVFSESEGEQVDITNNFIENLKNDYIFMQGFSNIDLESIRKIDIRGFSVINFKIRGK